MKIFLSYGHDEYEKLAQRLKDDLEEEGYEIWVDKERIKGSADWESAIEKGISTADWLVLLMTEHSVRRPDGVCLDEVSYARFLGKNIAPIMIQEVQPPLCIARIQWIDMKNFLIPGKAYFDEESYQNRKAELLSILQGIQQLNFEGGQKSLKRYLNPLDNDVYSEKFRQNFYGRQNLLKYYDDWYKSDSRVLWLVGDAGIGKTAFVANLSAIRGEIQAIHFCRYNDNERADAKRAIMSIAYYLATQISEYNRQLLELQDLDNLLEKNAVRLFDYLIAEPLNKISYQGNPIVIVIDALDEATVDERNELADIAARYFEKTPDWIKLVITSRKEVLLERKLSKYRAIDFADSQICDNNADVLGYLSAQLRNYLPAGKKGRNLIHKIAEKSEGIFLYAKTIVDEIQNGHLSVSETDRFPDGLTGIYFDYFERIFQCEKMFSYKRDIRPIMEILCATCAPVSVETLCDILEIDEYDADDICELICEMFPVKEGVIEPIHKSIIDWLIDSRKSGKYRVSAKKGHGKIADYYMSRLNKKYWDIYAIKYLCKHLLAEERTEESSKLLSNYMLIEKRIQIMRLDSTVREYLYELEQLNSLSPEETQEVFISRGFEHLFSKYRKFFYNSGLYFSLKRCDFDIFLSRNGGYEQIDGQIGVAYYYYITENFAQTVTVSQKILESTEKLAASEQSELYNLIALCYRKSVEFGKAKEYFSKAFEIGKQTKEYYNQSISLINLGKIAYHELDWSEAAVWNEKAISYLQKELKEALSEDYKISLELFIAEYHRLSAECLIWNGDLVQVNRELECSRKIYERIQSRDRYYIRYLYTTAFKNLLSGDFDEVYEECEMLLQQATSSYDKSQILFYRSIAAAKLGKMREFLLAIRKAYDYAKSIGAWLEMEEIIALYEKMTKGSQKLSHSDYYITNSFIQQWINYAAIFLDNIFK